MGEEDAVATTGKAMFPIGELARRTGMTAAVLRIWEARYGFPEAVRLASGHRRYREDHVRQVEQVLRQKEAGVRLDVAIAATGTGSEAPTPSVFAELRRRHPELLPNRLRKSTLIALSWAIEDSSCAVADAPVVFGAFQRPEFYLPSAERWSELSRVARSAVVFADDWRDVPEDARGPVRATLADNAPMRREWVIVCDAPESPACLAAWEVPGQAGVPDRERVFEAVWTVDPVAVRHATRVCVAVAVDAGVPLPAALLDTLAGPPGARPPADAAATALFNRVVAYVDRLG